jgi:predicted phage gp36 major capsid-like protein
VTTEASIAINGRVKDIIRQWGLRDLDDFSLKFATRAASLIAAGRDQASAIQGAFRETGEAFRAENRGRLEGFEAEVAERIRGLAPLTPTSLIAVLRAFREFAERQLVSGFKKNPNEEYCRSILQSYLERDGRTTREWSQAEV